LTHRKPQSKLTPNLTLKPRGAETLLKKQAVLTAFLIAFAFRAAPPVLAVNRDIIQIQQQLATLQQTVENLQKTVDTQSAILKTLVEQASDNVNSMKAAITELQRTNGQNLAVTNSHFDSMSSQIQALSESLDETKERLAKLSEQLAQTQNTIQTLSAPAPATAPGSAGGSVAGSAEANAGAARPAVPDPDSLYKAGYGDYTTGHYDLAIQEFREYLQYYGDTDLASNAQFYVGDSYYNQKQYRQAIDEYNQCLERYPKGNKLAAAQLKKAYALIALGQTQAGAQELRSLIRRFPGSHESELARQRLKRL
jgi:tol-pal system protein YbgF